jgi:hypothetical protein
MLCQKTIPGITMTGTVPTFYKINITSALAKAVAAQYPVQPTIVHSLLPPVTQPDLLEEFGMRPLDNRAIILGCFRACSGPRTDQNRTTVSLPNGCGNWDKPDYH